MPTVKDILFGYQKKLDLLDIELIISRVIKKPREFVLAHPEYSLSQAQEKIIKKFANRREKHEPLAYILGNKEFYGLDFKVTKHTLIPRPETELLVELAAWNIKHRTRNKKVAIIDVGTGSGNIIISLANVIKNKEVKLLATDIHKNVLRVAKYNAKKNDVHKKIKFIKGNLLEPNIKNKSCLIFPVPYSMIIVANLPYLSKKIYSETAPDVKKFEPKSALLSDRDGLTHYKKLLRQICKIKKHCHALRISCFFEISPEQKNLLENMFKRRIPSTKIRFHRDLAKKWRIAEFSF